MFGRRALLNLKPLEGLGTTDISAAQYLLTKQQVRLFHSAEDAFPEWVAVKLMHDLNILGKVLSCEVSMRNDAPDMFFMGQSVGIPGRVDINARMDVEMFGDYPWGSSSEIYLYPGMVNCMITDLSWTEIIPYA